MCGVGLGRYAPWVRELCWQLTLCRPCATWVAGQKVGLQKCASTGRRRWGCRPMACTRGSRSGDLARSQAARRVAIALSGAYLWVPTFVCPPPAGGLQRRQRCILVLLTVRFKGPDLRLRFAASHPDIIDTLRRAPGNGILKGNGLVALEGRVRRLAACWRRWPSAHGRQPRKSAQRSVRPSWPWALSRCYSAVTPASLISCAQRSWSFFSQSRY